MRLINLDSFPFREAVWVEDSHRKGVLTVEDRFKGPTFVWKGVRKTDIDCSRRMSLWVLNMDIILSGDKRVTHFTRLDTIIVATIRRFLTTFRSDSATLTVDPSSPATRTSNKRVCSAVDALRSAGEAVVIR